MADDACPVAVFASRHPSEQELISSYLLPRLTKAGAGGDKSSSLRCRFIHHADAYAADPADLTARFLPARAADGTQAWYFFSPVRTTTKLGKRRARAVESGAGCWHSEAGVRAVVDAGGRRVGHRQFFSFVKKREDGKRVRTGWLMVELGLDRETTTTEDASASDGLVLCKIYMTPRMPSSSPSVVKTTMELPGNKRKTTDEMSCIAPDATSPLQQRLHYMLPEAADSETQDGSKENSSESVVMLVDNSLKEDGSRSKETSDDDCVMLADAREDEDSTQGESETNLVVAGRSDGVEHGTVDDDDDDDRTRHGSLLLPDLNVATVSEEYHARDGSRRQDGSTFPQEASMAAERSTTTGGCLPRYRRTLMLLLDDGYGVEEEHQQQPPPATTTTTEAMSAPARRTSCPSTLDYGAQLQLRQPPCCSFVVLPCAAHAKMRHGATYGCGCRVTGSVRRGGYHLPRT